MTGSVPGRPSERGSTAELGGASTLSTTGQLLNILVAVSISAWTSRPTIVIQSLMGVLLCWDGCVVYGQDYSTGYLGYNEDVRQRGMPVIKSLSTTIVLLLILIFAPGLHAQEVS